MIIRGNGFLENDYYPRKQTAMADNTVSSILCNEMNRPPCYD